MIIWFHADELDEAKGPAGPEPADATCPVRRDGIRLTFNADLIADGAVSGKSDAGDCRVGVDEMDQL